jgi:hypothetical protein
VTRRHFGGRGVWQIPTRVPMISGLLHIAIVPGGHCGSGPVGIGTESSTDAVGAGAATAVAGVAGVATAGTGFGDAAGAATVAVGVGGSAGVAAASIGSGDGVWVATAGADRRGVDEAAGAPVMLGARAIGPGDGSAAIGKLAVAGGAESLIGAQAPTNSGSATRITADPNRPLRDRFLSSLTGIGPPARVVCRQITVSAPGREQRARWDSTDVVEQRRQRATQFDGAVGLAQHRAAHVEVAVAPHQIGKAGGE